MGSNAEIFMCRQHCRGYIHSPFWGRYLCGLLLGFLPIAIIQKAESHPLPLIEKPFSNFRTGFIAQTPEERIKKMVESTILSQAKRKTLYLAPALSLAPQAGTTPLQLRNPILEAPPSPGSQIKIRLFGSIEFRGDITKLTKWNGVIQRQHKEGWFAPGERISASLTWQEIINQTKNLSILEKLNFVNTFWNQWPYRNDKDLYKQEDYWATPREFKQNSGDCEDYCIAKYYMLKHLGVSPQQMRLVVVIETIRDIAHAVLVVYTNNTAYVLDNLSKSVLEHTFYLNNKPQFSVKASERGLHAVPKNDLVQEYIYRSTKL